MKNKPLIVIVAAIVMIIAVVLISKRGAQSASEIPVEEKPKIVSEFPSPDKVRAITEEKAAHHGHDHGESGDHVHDDDDHDVMTDKSAVDVPEAVEGETQDIEEAEDVVVAESIEIPANTPLALVNNIPLTLKDIVPVRPEDESLPVKMDPVEFAARLDKAIETEVTYQAAREQGISLSDEQMKSVHAIGDRKRADVESYRQKGMNWSTVTEEQIALQEYQAAALLLQKNLMKEAGIPTAPVLTDVQIDTYYQANKDQFGELPEDPAAREEAWNTIHGDIVQILFPYIQAQTAEQQKQFIEGLIAKAGVEVVPLDAE